MSSATPTPSLIFPAQGLSPQTANLLSASLLKATTSHRELPASVRSLPAAGGGDMNRVLHVDDEPDILEVARFALEVVGGLTVEQAGSGQEALQILARRLPDLILLDVMMPDMEGPTLLAKLRLDPRTASIPVVFMSAKVQTHEVQQYLAMGAAGVIPKPFDPMTLAAGLREIRPGREGPGVAPLREERHDPGEEEARLAAGPAAPPPRPRDPPRWASPSALVAAPTLSSLPPPPEPGERLARRLL